MSENVVLQKSYQFALRIVKLYKYLSDEKREYIISKQVMLSGTQIGARIKSAQEAESKPVFYSEMGIALRKTAETEYWLELLRAGNFLSEEEFDSIDPSRLEIKKLPIAINKSGNRLE